MRTAVSFLILAALHGSCASRPGPGHLPVVYRTDFTRGAREWEPGDPDAWRLATVAGDRCYELFAASDYRPPVRSPRNLSLLRDVEVGDFILDVELKSTHEDYGHRDLCIVFGYRDPSHFFYVHLGKKADAHANSIFVVDGAPRVSVAKTRTDGTPWDDAWHRVRVTRRGGAIAVYFDDLDTPVMTAEDGRFPRGRIGLGSFDDTGMFDDVVLRGERD